MLWQLIYITRTFYTYSNFKRDPNSIIEIRIVNQDTNNSMNNTTTNVKR